MMKRLHILHPPADLSLALLVRGGSLSQRLCAATGRYLPDREAEPLTLEPSVWLHDPAGLLAGEAAPPQDAVWYAVPAGAGEREWERYRIAAATPGYELLAGGGLRVGCNTAPGEPLTLHLSARVRHPRSGWAVRLHAARVLTASVVRPVATLTLDKPASWLFDPTKEGVRHSVSATLRLGGQRAPAQQCRVRWWWYCCEEGGERLVDAQRDLFYESGQGTPQLTFDARYLSEPLRLRCRAAYALPGEELAPEPAEGLQAETLVVRRYPHYSFESFIHGGPQLVGERVKSECVVTLGGRVVEEPSRHFMVRWSLRPAGSEGAWSTVGYGNSITLATASLAAETQLGLEVAQRSPLGALACEGAVICDGDQIITL